MLQVMAKEGKVSVLDHMKGTRERTEESDPITVAGTISERWTPCRTEGLPEVGPYTLRIQATHSLKAPGFNP